MRDTFLASPLRSLALLEAVISDAGQSSVAAVARSTGVPVASAHRHISALVSAGYLVPAGYGRHLAGSKLRALAGMIDDKQVVVGAATPILNQLASRTRCVVQLGTFENDMVTYRLKTGRSAGDLFTKVGLQLEAYCSAIGKVLLAHLPVSAQAAYLANGPFIALTPHTITDPRLLKVELDCVAAQGFACDDEEVAAGLLCIAVPVFTSNGDVIAAISASKEVASDDRRWRELLLPLLQSSATEISCLAFR